MAASTVAQPSAPESMHLKTLRREFEKSKVGRGLKQDSLVSTASTSSAAQDDLARILEPSQKKLTTVESQRVLSVLDECIKKLQIISVLPNVMRDVGRYSVSLGSDVVGLLEEHARLRGEYHDVLREEGERVDSVENLATSTSQLSLTDSPMSSPSLSAFSSKPRKLDPLSDVDGSSGRSAEELRSLLRHSACSLVRAFLNSPSAMTTIKGLECTSPCVTGCQAELQGLRAVVLERLLTTQQEKDNQEDKIASLAERLQQTMSAVHQLEKELATAESVREEEKSKRMIQLEKLMSQKKAVKKLSEEANCRVRADASKQVESSKQSHEAKWAQLDEERTTLRKQYGTVVAANREKELQLRKKAYKRETEVDNWILKYDTEMGQKQDEFEEIKDEYDKEREQHRELNEKFAVMEVEYNHVEEEKRVAREKAEEVNRQLTLMTGAAIAIQAFWRRYRRRKAALREQQRSGKKKGKGKGKKKK